MRGEPDRYLAATLASRQIAPALAAIAAFAAELGRIAATVSEPTLGDIRLQWWRDALAVGRAEGGAARSGHPVADAVVASVERHRLPGHLLDAMIDAREFDLSGGLLPDDAGLAAYLEATEGHAFRLALLAVGAPAASVDGIARPAGLAYGLARGLGRLPMLLHNGGLPLPAERLRAEGLDPDGLARQPHSAEVTAAVTRVVADLTALARTALAEARERSADLSRPMRAAMLPLAMVEPYFRSLSGRPPLDHMAGTSPLARVVRIGMAHVTGRP